MYGQISTVAFVGIEAKPVEVQVRISGGGHVFAVVGLPDKAVAESRERVRNALHAVGLGLPFKHITVNLAPADLPKEGSHFDLPIALAMMVAMGAISPDAIEGYAAIGELALDGFHPGCAGSLAGGHRRQCHGQGADLPGCMRIGSGVGRRGHDRAGPAASAFARQPLQGTADAVAAQADRGNGAATAARPRAMSRVRKAPSARWRSPPPADTTC